MNSTEAKTFVAPAIRAFVIENFLFGERETFTDDDSFLAMGIIDSTSVLEFVSFLETQYEIRIENDELMPVNLDSVNKAASFIARKLGD